MILNVRKIINTKYKTQASFQMYNLTQKHSLFTGGERDEQYRLGIDEFTDTRNHKSKNSRYS